MKRLFTIILLFAFAMLLAACANTNDSLKVITKEGIKPYKLSKNEKYLLQAFGLEEDAQIISFFAPKEAITLKVNVYRLGGGNTWEIIGGGGVSIGYEREPVEQLTGTFTMQLEENYAINFIVNINNAGKGAYKTNEVLLDTERLISTKVFLQEFQKIELNQKIPVALLVYDSGTTMRSYALQDYFNPEKFAGMDLVQAVTLTFTDNEL